MCVTARSQARATATMRPPWRVPAQAPGFGRNDRFTARGPSKGFGMLLGSTGTLAGNLEGLWRAPRGQKRGILPGGQGLLIVILGGIDIRCGGM